MSVGMLCEISLKVTNEIAYILPSVSFLGTVKSSSLATFLWCPKDPTNGIEGVWDDECAAVLDDDDDNAGGRSGLHGEWELADVLVDAAIGTPAADGYKSWLNYKKVKKKWVSTKCFKAEINSISSLIRFFIAELNIPRIPQEIFK